MNKKEIKNYLNEIKDDAVKQNPTDKPFIRQYLNDTADSICRYLEYINMKDEITKKNETTSRVCSRLCSRPTSKII